MSNITNRREPLTIEQAKDLGISDEYFKSIQDLEGYIRSTGKTQAVVAKELGGKTDGLVSNFLAGKYNAPHTVIPLVEQLLKMNENRLASPKEPPFKMTSISRQVTNIITYCHIQGKIGVAYGDAGVGKTMAVEQYKKEHPEAVRVTLSPCFGSITGVNELLKEELNIKGRVSRQIFLEAVNKLKDSKRVIMVDEAQHLTVKAIDHLRSIADKSGVGIAFVGNEEIYTKMRGAGQDAYVQLFSRIGRHDPVRANTFKLNDIRLVFKYMKDAVKKTYAAKGEAVLNMNYTAIDKGVSDIAEISVPEEWSFPIKSQ